MSFHKLSHTTTEQTETLQSFSRVGRELHPLQNDKQGARRCQRGPQPRIPRELWVQGPYTNEAKQRRELVSSSQGMPVTECYRARMSSLFSENDRWMWETFLGTIFTGPGMFLNKLWFCWLCVFKQKGSLSRKISSYSSSCILENKTSALTADRTEPDLSWWTLAPV